MTSHYAYEPMTTLHNVRSVLGQPFDVHFLLGSHNFMVTALANV